MGALAIQLQWVEGNADKAEDSFLKINQCATKISDAELELIENRDKVNVKLNGEKGGIITNVYLKVSDDAFFELHLDTDDANAHLIKNGDIGEII